MQQVNTINESPNNNNTLLKTVRLVVWLSAIICLTVVFNMGFNKQNFLKAFTGSDKFLQDKNYVDSVLLNAGDLNFSDKTSFVVDAFRYQGNYEQLPEKLNIDKDRQKLYNYIFQRKSNQLNKTTNTINSIKPIKPADFSIKSISNP